MPKWQMFLISMISEEINHIVEFINNLNDTPKAVLKKCIKTTLVKSEIIYNDTLEKTQEYLLSRNPVQVLKTINREQKRDERKKYKLKKENSNEQNS
jgi:hypothetical protein